MSSQKQQRMEWSLVTSALMLATALVVLLIRPLDPSANAGDSTVPAANGIGAITLTNGEGPKDRPSESVYLLDNRTETLMIYSVEVVGPNRSLVLRDVESLPALFRAGRPR